MASGVMHPAPLVVIMQHASSCASVPPRCRMPRPGLEAWDVHHAALYYATANLRTKIPDFRGFDSSMILTSRGGILTSIGCIPEMLSREILLGTILVGRFGRTSCRAARQQRLRARPGDLAQVRQTTKPQLNNYIFISICICVIHAYVHIYIYVYIYI